MNNILRAKNRTYLMLLPNHSDGEIAYLDEEKQYMIYKDGQGWIEFNPKTKDITMSLYEINKQIIEQLSPLSKQQLSDMEDSLTLWGKASLYMLYGKEISYFTLLSVKDDSQKDFKTFGEAIISLLHDLTDTIYSIDVVDDNSVEIWIKYEDKATVLYLFNYEGGLVTYGR